MIRSERSFTGTRLVVAAAAFALAGCGSSDDGNNDPNPAGNGGAPVGNGGAPVGNGGTPVVGNGGTPVVGNGGTPVVGNGGTPVVGNGGMVQGTGGVPGTGGVIDPGGTGGVPTTGGVPGTGGVGNPGPTDNIDPVTGKLIAPKTGDGIQISTKAFVINPGQELFKCFHAEVPLDGEIDVSRFESQMSKGSHHFILYRADTDTAPSGSLTDSGCTLGFDQRWIYTSGSPHSWLDMPKDVAMVLNQRQKVVFDMHYINTTSEPINAQVILNINLAKGTFQKAAALVSFNTGIFIPANGKQTVGGDCTPGAGAKFFLMSTHTHKRGIDSSITRVNAGGQMGEQLVHTTDWEHPGVGSWMAEPFLTFGAGEKFHYSCSFQNDRASLVTVGTSAETNEMCMAITYYFPASAGGSCR